MKLGADMSESADCPRSGTNYENTAPSKKSGPRVMAQKGNKSTDGREGDKAENGEVDRYLRRGCPFVMLIKGISEEESCTRDGHSHAERFRERSASGSGVHAQTAHKNCPK